jgi:hypothetical protein
MNPNQEKPERDDVDKEIQAALRQETAVIDPNEGLDRFMEAVAANPKPRPSWWQRINGWLGDLGFMNGWLRDLGFTPALTSVAVMQLGVIAVLLATQPPRATAPYEIAYRGIAGEARQTPDLKLTVNPDADFASLAALLRANGCRIVAGPSELGEIWVVVDDKANLVAVRKSLGESSLLDDVAAHE